MQFKWFCIGWTSAIVFVVLATVIRITLEVYL